MCIYHANAVLYTAKKVTKIKLLTYKIMNMNPANVSPSFQYVKPTDEQIALMQIFRDTFEAVYLDVKTNCPYNRGTNLALTKLEESAMWLNKGITENC